MKKTLFFLIVIVGHSIHSYSQVKYEDIIDKFYSTYEKDPLKAYEDLFKANKWIESSVIEKNKIDFRDFLKDLGDYCGYELITTKQLGQSYIFKSYLIKYDRQPFRIKLSFYKSKSDWKLQNFSYDTKFDDEVEDAAKLDRVLIFNDKK